MIVIDTNIKRQIRMSSPRTKKPQKKTRVSPISKRLEDIRSAEDLTVRAFFDEIGANAFASYAAAVTYHAGREPPVQYLVAAARRFGYRLEWLATGEGERKPMEEAARSELRWWLDKRISTVFREYYRLPSPLRVLHIYPIVQRFLEVRYLEKYIRGEGLQERPSLEPRFFPAEPDADERDLYRYIRRHTIGAVVEAAGAELSAERVGKWLTDDAEFRSEFGFMEMACHTLRMAYYLGTEYRLTGAPDCDEPKNMHSDKPESNS
jgi:hypothetical protein